MLLQTVWAILPSRRSPPGANVLPLVAAALSLLLPAAAGAADAPAGWAIPLQSPYDAAKQSPAEELRCQGAAEAAAREAADRYLRELPERQTRLETLRKENLEAWRQCARFAADGWQVLRLDATPASPAANLCPRDLLLDIQWGRAAAQ